MSQSSNIVVVNANNTDRTSLVNSLKELYTTHVFGSDSALECLDYLHGCKQSVIVLLDIEAPLATKGLYGLALINHITRDINLGHVTVVATSKIANEQLMISSIESGAVDHLVFPMTSLTLKSLWLNASKKQKIRALEAVRSSENLEIVTNHSPINSWEYHNVIQLMNQFCSPLVDINLSSFPKIVERDQAMLAKVQNWDFDAFSLNEDEVFTAILTIFDDLQVFGNFNIDRDTFHRFLLAIRANYRDNPYHNFRHGVDVLQSFYYLLITSTLIKHLKKIEVLALAVASLSHDIAHPGLNNFYHVNAQTPLALLYNNKAVLENFHATATFCILMRPEFNFVSSFNQHEFKTFRDVVISSIMSTDMAVHFDFIGDLKRRYEREDPPFSLEVKEDVKLMATCLVKCSDISNVTRPFHVSIKWSKVLLDEFQAQGSLEKSSNLPIYPFGKEDIVLPVSQKDFISFVALPLFDVMAKLSDAFAPLLTHLKENLTTWINKINENKPELEQDKKKPDVKPPIQKQKSFINDRRKSLPAAQFVRQMKTVRIQEPISEKKEKEKKETHSNGNNEAKNHRRSTSESIKNFNAYSANYSEEDSNESSDSGIWLPPLQKISALQTLDGGTNLIFKRRHSLSK